MWKYKNTVLSDNVLRSRFASCLVNPNSIPQLFAQELHKKREEKRLQNQQKAEEEVRYLQASGKISKSAANKSNVKKSKASSTGKKYMWDMSCKNNGG